MNRQLLIGALLLLVALNVGCASGTKAASTVAPPDGAPFVLPGAPLAPEQAVGGDWFARGREDEQKMSLKALKGAIATVVKSRKLDDAEAPVDILGVTIQDRQYSGPSGDFEGYTIRYSDRISIVFMPTDSDFNLTERLATTDSTTTEGKTHLWRPASVRGFNGAYREPATQRWENGVTNEMPAVLEWTEPIDSAPGFMCIAIMGDRSCGELVAVATQIANMP